MPWKSDFYPPELDAKDYLSYYSSRFDFVEVNLGEGIRQIGGSLRNDSAYSFLSKYARVWSAQTPDDFHFAIRIPNAILFPSENSSSNFAQGGVSSSICPDTIKLGEFLEKLAPIEEKILAVTIDVPSSLNLALGRGWLDSVLSTCTYQGHSVALQFNHTSWFQDLTYNILEKHGASVIWPYDIDRPLSNIVTTADFMYFRPRYYHQYSGNNNSANNGEGSIKLQLSGLIDAIKDTIQEETSLEYAIVVTTNPVQANLICELLELPQKKSGSLKLPLTHLPADNSSNGVNNENANISGLVGNFNQAEAASNRIIVCVDLNAFYPSCEELRNPSLKGKSHAVIMTDQKEGSITKGVVSSCSYEARKYGVRSAMGLSRAKLLCPDLILLPVDIPYYSKVSEQVMSVLDSFADVLEQASIDEAFLECSTKIEEKNSAVALEQFGMSIKQAVKEKCAGLLCSVGIAPTKSAAKIASDYKKPDGLTVVPASDVKAFLAPLEVNRVAGIGQKTEQALRQMRITTVGQLAATDVQRLQDRFGKNGHWMWKVANGADDEPVEPRGDHVSISTETTLESFTRDKEKIQSLLLSLADEIYQRALEHNYTFRTLGVKLVRTDFSIETRETTFAEQQGGKNSITSVIAPLLEKFMLSEKDLPIRKVGLKLSHLVKNELSSSERARQSDYYTDVQKTLLDYF